MTEVVKLGSKGSTLVDSIIIGCGISGLNIAHQLKNIKHDENFIVLQDTLELDSRVKTHIDPKLTCELGASIFNITHDVLFDLIKYYGLSDKLIDITDMTKTYYFLDGHNLTQNQIIQRHDEIDEILKQKANDKLTLHQLLLQEIPMKKDRELYISTTTGYYESKDRISSTYFDESDVVDSTGNKTYSMRGGLSQLMNAIYSNVKDHVKFGQKVKTISKLENDKNSKYEIFVRDVIGNNFVKYRTNKLFLCINKTALINIECVGIDLKPLLKLVKRISSFREYIVFKKPINELFELMKDYNYVMTNLHFHWMIKSNDKTVMMYTDGELADYLHSMSEESRIEVYLRNLSIIFNKTLDRDVIDFVVSRYWSEAFVVVRKKYYNVYDEIIKEIEDQSIKQTIVPKDKGFSEGWMNASLIKI
jgi:monoamine oxidase